MTIQEDKLLLKNYIVVYQSNSVCDVYYQPDKHLF